jgi:hypothetical protein
MKKTFVLFLYILFVSPTGVWLWAQSYTAVPVPLRYIQFSPARYYIGDTVTIQLSFKAPSAAQLVVPPFTKNDIMSIDSIQIDQQVDIVNVQILAHFFIPGNHQLNLDFGVLKIEPIPIYVSSVLTDTDASTNISLSNPTLLPGTQIIVTLLLALLLLLPVLAYILYRVIRYIIYPLMLHKQSPQKQLLIQIGQLQKNKNITDKLFFFDILRIMRQFLYQYTKNGAFLSATHDELAHLLPQVISSSQLANALLDIFSRGDFIRFGHATMLDQERETCIHTLLQLANELDHNKKEMQ